MGKGGFVGPKAVARHLKAKGLQKLCWYCQMCEKQCRDENGFRCHCLAESHQRQLLLASERPQQSLDAFSEAFRKDFLALLRRRFGTERVHNNVAYQEYIRHREHIHMNATRWETLTEFTKWLGREGDCTVDETPEGWYLRYIDRDPETVLRQRGRETRRKRGWDDEEKAARFIEEQVRRGLAGKEHEGPVYTELTRENPGEKVVLSLNRGASTSTVAPPKPSLLGPSGLKMAVKHKGTPPASGQSKEKKRKTALEEILHFEEKKEKSSRADPWLQSEIVVKIITKKLGEKYHLKKAVVKEVINKYTAVVKLIDSGDKLKLDQAHLETVLPAPGRKVLVLNGSYRGSEATLEGINEKTFSATILIQTGPQAGCRVEGVPYEDISKRA